MIHISVKQTLPKDHAEKMNKVLEGCIIDEMVKWAKQDDEYLRANDGFVDHTGNLRSSLGAAVVKDARVVFQTAFQTVLGGAEGSAAGKQAVRDSATHLTRGIAKVMVAGMDYAQRVEDIESKDVLESRRLQCERDAKAVLERALRNADRKMKALL